ncbi:hypothetical protein BGZ72_009079 [Mortierella alpina]|nr:hypothetical protein BGZ72_009079 [Mortierella alpina]
MQSPASSIQSPRPPGRPPQVPFDKELMASLHVLLNQLGEVERQGLVMFHKIEESFKHPYTQQEAIADTANLLIQLDALSSQAKTTGFGALTILPTSPTVASTPSASASAAAGTPKPMFMSPRMQNHIHNNLNIIQGNNHSNNNTAAHSLMDTQMQSPTSLSLVSTPAASGSGSTPAAIATTMGTTTTTATIPISTTPGAPTPVTNPGSATATPAAAAATTGSGGGVRGAASPFSSSDIVMTSTSTPAASGPGSSSSVTDPSASGTSSNNNSNNNNAVPAAAVATPATPSASSVSGGVEPGVALAQMMDARNRDVQALYTEKRKLKSSLQIAAKMSRT